MNREDIYTALFAKLSAIPDFVTTGRRLKLWTDLKQEQKPALYMLQRGDEYVRTERVPAKVTLNVDVFIYTATPQGSAYIPATQMNNLLDAVDAALQPAPYETRQTLDGLVSHCWIEGEIKLDPGELDGQGIAVIPIKILATY